MVFKISWDRVSLRNLISVSPEGNPGFLGNKSRVTTDSSHQAFIIHLVGWHISCKDVNPLYAVFV